MVSGYDSAIRPLHMQVPLPQAARASTTVAVGCLQLALALENLGDRPIYFLGLLSTFARVACRFYERSA